MDKGFLLGLSPLVIALVWLLIYWLWKWSKVWNYRIRWNIVDKKASRVPLHEFYPQILDWEDGDKIKQKGKEDWPPDYEYIGISIKGKIVIAKYRSMAFICEKLELSLADFIVQPKWVNKSYKDRINNKIAEIKEQEKKEKKETEQRSIVLDDMYSEFIKEYKKLKV